MKFGFLLFDYFPFGGLERDCLRIAEACAARGHQITLLTRSWEGERPATLAVELFGRHGFNNTSRNRYWVQQLTNTLPERSFDCVIGFNKLPHLDVYFGADLCFAEKLPQKPFWYRWLPRYRNLLMLERAVFARGLKTEILVLTARDIAAYKKFYGTEDRFHILPANAARRLFTPQQQNAAREKIRRENAWAPTTNLLLFVGSDFQRKGVDRIIRSLVTLDQKLLAQTQLALLGHCEPDRFVRLARQAGVAEHVHFFGGRTDAPDWMLAADALVHPARSETAGAVLVEALASGLPVITTAACGYAFHVDRAHAGVVLPEPFQQDALNQALQTALTSAESRSWRANALAYAATADLYGCHATAAEIIEQVAHRKCAGRPSI